MVTKCTPKLFFCCGFFVVAFFRGRDGGLRYTGFFAHMGLVLGFGWWLFSSLARILGECSTIHPLPALFFFLS